MKNRTMNRMTTFAFLLALVWTVTSGCTFASHGVKGDGNVVKQERPVSPFTGIEVGGAFKVYLTQGNSESLVVEADENLLDLIETEVRGNTLMIRTRKDIRDPEALNIYVTFKELNSLDISGACQLSSDDKLKFDDMHMDCSGASQMELFGAAETMELDLSGASHLDASDLEVKVCDADVSGASHGKINVSGELSAGVSGAASLKYRGDAVVRDHDVSGAGSLKKY